LRKFGETHFARNAAVSSEEIVDSPLWTTAPGEWRVCPRGRRAHEPWRASRLDDPRPEHQPSAERAEHDRQILERRIPELGKMKRANFAAIVLELWKRGVPFDKKIEASPFWNSAPNQWRNRAWFVLRMKSIARYKERGRTHKPRIIFPVYTSRGAARSVSRSGAVPGRTTARVQGGTGARRLLVDAHILPGVRVLLAAPWRGGLGFHAGGATALRSPPSSGFPPSCA
jgi:hypothetical protein